MTLPLMNCCPGTGGNTETKTEASGKVDTAILLADGKEWQARILLSGAYEAGISERTVQNAKRMAVYGRKARWSQLVQLHQEEAAARNCKENESAKRRAFAPCTISHFHFINSPHVDRMGLFSLKILRFASINCEKHLTKRFHGNP